MTAGLGHSLLDHSKASVVEGVSRTRIATINQLYWQRLNNHSYKRCWVLEWILIALCRNLIKVHQHCWNILHYSNSHVLIRKFVYQKAFIQSDKTISLSIWWIFDQILPFCKIFWFARVHTSLKETTSFIERGVHQCCFMYSLYIW